MTDKLITGVLLSLLGILTVPAFAEIPQKNERQPEQESIQGYTDTPLLPGGEWHVHDPNRPQPEVVDPNYDGKPVTPPPRAQVLFDGSDLTHWNNKNWKLKKNYMIVNNGSQTSTDSFGDVYLHVEWMIPESVSGWGQKRGNSGVILMGRYEVQVLDGWANRTYPDGMPGAIYGQNPPRFNACRKPGQWQSYDIFFRAPETEDGNVTKPARMSVLHNGIPIQNNFELLGPVTHADLAEYRNPPSEGPIKLQDHGNPIRYRNIWVFPMD